MAEHFNIIGNYRKKSINNHGEIKVYFSFLSNIKKNLNCEICIHFSQENHHQFYLQENIIGFAKQVDIYDKNETYPNEKAFHIDLYEDIEKFHFFNAILNEESQISLSLTTIDDIEGFLIPMGTIYQDAIESNKKISKSYLEFIDYARERNFEKLKNYFPILGYTLSTSD